MVMVRQTCVICGKYITEQFWVCAKCAKKFGLDIPYRDWPEWAKELVRLERRFRTEDRKIHKAPLEMLDNYSI